MSFDPDSMKEIAKTAGKIVDAGDKFASFIVRFSEGSLKEGFGIIEDKLRYMRWERQIRLMQKAEEYLDEVGLAAPTRPIQFKFLVPLLQAATLEEDDYLQDLWAALLVNFANTDSNVKITMSYIDILEKLSPLEAKILQTIYALPFEEMKHAGIVTTELPERAFKRSDDNQVNDNQAEESKMSTDIVLALANLSRLGCLNSARSWGGGEIFHTVNPALLGKHFVEACTLKSTEI